MKRRNLTKKLEKGDLRILRDGRSSMRLWY